MIGPHSSAKLVSGHGTTVVHFLAMAFDGPSMDDDLRTALAAHDIIVLWDEWGDGRPRLGVVCVTEDQGLEQRPRTEDAARDVNKNWGSERIIYYARGSLACLSWGISMDFLGCGGVPLRRRQAHFKRHP